MPLRCLLLFAALLISLASSAQTIAPNIIFPSIAPPYNAVINTTIEGIENILSDSSQQEYKSDKQQSLVNSIILTNKIKKEIQQSDSSSLQSSVIGLAELPLSDEVYGVSMFISTDTYITEIIELNPAVTEVVFLYDRRRYPAINNLRLSEEHQLSVTSMGAENTAEALDAFSNANRSASPSRALVFTRGFIELNESTLLDFITRQTWDSQALTVANRPSYIEAGLVLGVLPDFFGYGQQIGELFLQAQSSDFRRPQVELLERTIGAINIRTAGHLRLNVSRSAISRYKLSYPSK